MPDKDLMALSTLADIKYSIKLILKRFEDVDSSDAFLASDSGLEKLDSISMRLIAIGEGFKSIDKLTDYKFLENYPVIEWKNVKGVRDVLSHHYFDLDAEIIFNICENYLGGLLEVTEKMIKDIETD